MRILIVSQVFWPDNVAVAQHVFDLAEYLAEKGESVDALASTKDYENPSITYLKKENYQNINITRLNGTSFSKKSKIGRLINFTAFNLQVFFKILFLKKKEYDAVVGLTVPPMLSFLTLLALKGKNIKFVYWAMDLQPELSIIAGFFKEKSFATKLLLWMGNYVFKKADLIIALDKYMKDYISKRTGQTDKITVIPVWPVMHEIYNEEKIKNPFRIENNFSNKIIVMYSGNHSVMHPLDTLLKTALALRDDPRFLFVHIGGGVRIKDVSNFKDQHSLENILLLPYQPREKIHISLGAADLQVVIQGKECVGFTHPNKIYGAMFIGKPILYIGPKPSHVTDLLEKCTGNIMVSHGEEKKLIKELQNFALLSESKKQEISQNNRNFAKANFTKEFLLEKSYQALLTLV